MGFYTGVVYPAVLAVLGALTLGGIVTLIWVRAHRVLVWIVTATYVITVVQLFTIVGVLIGGNDASLVTTAGYLLVSVAVLPLLGIGRLGEPDAARLDPDPNRPVLQPDQIARVDAMAAIIIAIAAAVIAWRLEVLMTGGA